MITMCFTQNTFPNNNELGIKYFSSQFYISVHLVAVLYFVYKVLFVCIVSFARETRNLKNWVAERQLITIPKIYL